MENFDINLLQEVMQKVNKLAFVPSSQTQEAISAGQQEGTLPPPPAPAPGSGDQPQIGFPEMAQMMQQGFEGVMQGMQQLAQMVQQATMDLQTMKMSGNQGGKKKSVSERLDQLEQMLSQAMGQPAPQGEPAQEAPPQEAPPQGAPAEGQPPVQ